MSNLNCKVSIIIKALNEESSISRAIESALEAVKPFTGEVILADSLSTDQTIAIAEKYPIKIAQLTDPKDRCCGIGPQLGYELAQGEFVYILDGDMQMLDGFFQKAIPFLEQHPEYAGVGGTIIEMNTNGLEYQARVEREPDHKKPGEVRRLEMGGLYRTAAIEEVGYFSNRNLHAYEELDLGIRLRSKGYKLFRLDQNSVKHWGHDLPPYELLFKRWKSGYIMGLGETLRCALGQPHFNLLLQDVRELKIYMATIIWWLVILSTFFLPQDIFTNTLMASILLLAPLILMTIKKRSFQKALYSVVSWNFNAAGLLKGFLTPLRPTQISNKCHQIK